MARREWVPVFARINTSAKLVALPNDTYRLFFLMLLPQCDQWGRAPADPGVLDALVWPRFKWAVDVAGDALAACEAVGLIELHRTEGGESFLQVAGWESKAGRLYAHLKRGASEWPEPSFQSRVSRDSVATSLPLCAAPFLSSPLVVVRSPAVLALQPPPPPPNGDGSGKPKGKGGPRKPATGDQAEAIAWWCAEFQRTRGCPYAVAGGKDGAHVQAILKASSLSEFKLRSTALLGSQDAFYRGADLGTLRSAWNKLAAAKPPPRPSYDQPTVPETNGHKVDPSIARKAIKDALAEAGVRNVQQTHMENGA